MTPPTIPFDRLTTVFLDLGNTLISMDFEWLSRELAKRGVAAASAEVQRAEAAARPVVSRRLKQTECQESSDIFRIYLASTLDCLAAVREAGSEAKAALIEDLVPVLQAPGQTARLWSYVLPGVKQTLEALARSGLTVVVVSNSDGSAEESMIRQGLRHLVLDVVDSHVVGIEKPDSAIFAHALALAGARPSETLHIGDIYELDVVGARAAGLYALLIDPYGDWPDVDCQRIRSIADLTTTALVH